MPTLQCVTYMIYVVCADLAHVWKQGKKPHARVFVDVVSGQKMPGESVLTFDREPIVEMTWQAFSERTQLVNE